MASHNGETWTGERINALRHLWGEGCPTAEIAARLGLTKGQVIGKVHRLSLPVRPNPALPRATPVEAATQPNPHAVPRMTAYAPRAVPAMPPRAAGALAIAYPAEMTCQWPSGDPRGAVPWSFCGAPRRAGTPYCGCHADRAYGRALPVLSV